MPALWEILQPYPVPMTAISTFMAFGAILMGLCGCLPLTVASAVGLLVNDGSGVPAAQTANTPFLRESPWVKEHNPAISEASEASVLDECKEKLDEPGPQPPPSIEGEGRHERPISATEAAGGGAQGCTRRKVCLPGNRIPVDLLVCGTGKRALLKGTATARKRPIFDWNWESERSDLPASPLDVSGSPIPPEGNPHQP